MDWNTFIISVLSSGAVAALVNSLMNHRTQIQSIKESGLYVKRADVLDNLMKRLERLDQSVATLVSVFQEDGSWPAERERRIKAFDCFNAFQGYFRDKKHYLPKVLADEISVLCTEYHNLFTEFIYEVKVGGPAPDLKKWQEVVKRHKDDFSTKKEKVAEEFRKIIGVE